MSSAPRPLPLSDDASPGVPGSRDDPTLFRFGLRQFIVFISGMSVLLGAMALLRGGWAAGLGFFAALVAAHVTATFVGTRLRESAHGAERSGARRHAGVPAPPARLTPGELAALTATPLARCERAPLRTALAAVTGLMAGASVGAAAIPVAAGSKVTAAEVALGAVSCGVLGAWIALMAAHFLSVMRRTLRDANGQATGPRTRGPAPSSPVGDR
ncbi:MAG TPA: hypothetical protein VEQ85_00555 [Lacipirellulaceae bacterium]|nr:hypothetical protein [Lacipirellulaceae bacterium]